MITESMLPMVLLPLTFLFVLLIILIAKAPKAGAGVVGGLILLTPLCLYRLAQGGVLRQEEAIPLVVLPLTFLFVLLVILLAKAPKVGVGLVIALVVIGVLGGLWTVTSPRVSPSAGEIQLSQTWPQEQQTESGAGSARVEQRAQAVQEFDRVFSDYTRPEPPSAAAPLLDSGSVPPPPAPPAVLSPIWSEGVEKEFVADIYPSKLAAARAAGLLLSRSIRELAPDTNTPPHVVIFQEGHEHPLVTELRDAVRRALPGVSCDIEAESRNLRGQELRVMLHLGELEMHTAPWAGSGEKRVARGGGLVQVQPIPPAEAPLASGRLEIDLSGRGRTAHFRMRFAEKPWVEDFAAFTSLRPQQHFIVTRSWETCASETEASQQAVDDARARLTEALGKRMASRVGPLRLPGISTADVRQGGFIVDQFAQSFDGTAGRIWRHAMLLDVSGAKLNQLADLKIRQLHAQKMSWGRMGFSALGVVVLIGVIYFFLNMATMGYYEWSLRIAGVILAIVAVISILMVVH